MEANKDLLGAAPVSVGVWLWSDEGWDLSHFGTSLLQEDGCLNSGPKRMMKGTVYLVAAADCMLYFYKSGSEKLSVAGRWRNLC